MGISIIHEAISAEMQSFSSRRCRSLLLLQYNYALPGLHIAGSRMPRRDRKSRPIQRKAANIRIFFSVPRRLLLIRRPKLHSPISQIVGHKFSIQSVQRFHLLFATRRQHDCNPCGVLFMAAHKRQPQLTTKTAQGRGRTKWLTRG